jgi:hypothetical protein
MVHLGAERGWKMPLVTGNFCKLHLVEDMKQSGDVKIERTKKAGRNVKNDKIKQWKPCCRKTKRH